MAAPRRVAARSPDGRCAGCSKRFAFDWDFPVQRLSVLVTETEARNGHRDRSPEGAGFASTRWATAATRPRPTSTRFVYVVSQSVMSRGSLDALLMTEMPQLIYLCVPCSGHENKEEATAPTAAREGDLSLRDGLRGCYAALLPRSLRVLHRRLRHQHRPSAEYLVPPGIPSSRSTHGLSSRQSDRFAVAHTEHGPRTAAL
jgi:hypothetical protein